MPITDSNSLPDMPTSSQALLLKSSPSVPANFGLRFWQPQLSEKLPVPGDIIHSERRNDRDPSRKLFVSRTQNELPAVEDRADWSRSSRNKTIMKMNVDFSALSDVLQVTGIHGTLAYDHDSNYLKWHIHKVPNTNMLSRQRRVWSLTGLPFRKRQQKQPFMNSPRENFGDLQELTDKTKRGVDIHYSDPSKRFTTFMKYETSGSGFVEAKQSVLSQTNKEGASYFKLVRQDVSLNDTEDKHQSLFRLIPCSSEEARSFRLSPTGAGEVGDYQLVPREGYESGDFRIVTSHTDSDCVVLLQADSSLLGQYKPVICNKTDMDTTFRLVEAKIQERHEPENRNDLQTYEFNADSYQPVDRYTFFDDIMYMSKYNEHSNSPEGMLPDVNEVTNTKWTHNTSANTDSGSYRFHDSLTHRDKEMTQDRIKQSDISARRDINAQDDIYMEHNKDTHLDVRMQRETHEHRDITSQYGENQIYKTILTSSVANSDSDEKHKLIRADGRFVDNEVDSLKAKYLTGNTDREPENRNVHAQLSQRLTAAGKPRGNDPNTNGVIMTSDTGCGPGLKQEWHSKDFDQWSRTRESKYLGINIPEQLDQHKQENCKADERQSRLDQISMSADYRLWKKKKIASIRMRPVLPPSDRKAVCIKLKDNSITHERLKEILEKQTGTKLVNIQYDPVSVHLQDSEAKCQWILRFSEASVCDLLIISGLNIDGCTYRVRRFDDVMKEEYEAHKFYTIMKEIKDRKLLKSRNEQKHKDKAEKKMKGAHTQTTTKLPNITLQNSRAGN